MDRNWVEENVARKEVPGENGVFGRSQSFISNGEFKPQRQVASYTVNAKRGPQETSQNASNKRIRQGSSSTFSQPYHDIGHSFDDTQRGSQVGSLDSSISNSINYDSSTSLSADSQLDSDKPRGDSLLRAVVDRNDDSGVNESHNYGGNSRKTKPQPLHPQLSLPHNALRPTIRTSSGFTQQIPHTTSTPSLGASLSNYRSSNPPPFLPSQPPGSTIFTPSSMHQSLPYMQPSQSTTQPFIYPPPTEPSFIGSQYPTAGTNNSNYLPYSGLHSPTTSMPQYTFPHSYMNIGRNTNKQRGVASQFLQSFRGSPFVDSPKSFPKQNSSGRNTPVSTQSDYDNGPSTSLGNGHYNVQFSSSPTNLIPVAQLAAPTPFIRNSSPPIQPIASSPRYLSSSIEKNSPSMAQAQVPTVQSAQYSTNKSTIRSTYQSELSKDPDYELDGTNSSESPGHGDDSDDSSVKPTISSTMKARKPKSAQATLKLPKTGEKERVVRKEGLEETTIRIIRLLQQKGKMLFKEIHETLQIDYRRAYDILNVLITTPLVSKQGKKNENKLPYVYTSGERLTEFVDIDNILHQVSAEENFVKVLNLRIERIQQELAKTQVMSPKALLDEFSKDERFRIPNIERP